jgi:hypothetical protein
MNVMHEAVGKATEQQVRPPILHDKKDLCFKQHETHRQEASLLLSLLFNKATMT